MSCSVISSISAVKISHRLGNDRNNSTQDDNNSSKLRGDLVL